MFVNPGSVHRALSATTKAAPLALWVQQVSGVDSHSDEDQVVDEVSAVRVFKGRVRHERRTAAGDVHRRPRLLETGARRVRPKRVLRVSTIVSLVEQRQSNSLTKRPRQKVIVVALQTV